MLMLIRTQVYMCGLEYTYEFIYIYIYKWTQIYT